MFHYWDGLAEGAESGLIIACCPDSGQGHITIHSSKALHPPNISHWGLSAFIIVENVLCRLGLPAKFFAHEPTLISSQLALNR